MGNKKMGVDYAATAPLRVLLYKDEDGLRMIAHVVQKIRRQSAAYSAAILSCPRDGCCGGLLNSTSSLRCAPADSDKFLCYLR